MPSIISICLIPFHDVSKLNFLSFSSFFFIFLIIFTVFRSSHSYMPIMEPVSTGHAASNAMSEVHCALLVHFAEALKETDFRAYFNIG